MPSPDRERRYTTHGVDRKAQDYNAWLADRDGLVTVSMEKAGIHGWVVDGRVRHDIIQAIAGSQAIPMRPTDANSANGSVARDEVDQWEREWEGEMTYLLVQNPMHNNQFLHAPVPLELLVPDTSTADILDLWVRSGISGDPQAKSYRAAYIARIGRLPDTGPITGG